MSKAHSITTGDDVVVGLIDSGVEPHPDLRQNLLNGYNAVTKVGGGKSDAVGHGTQMAGIIAAHGKSGGRGVLGIAPGAKILPVKSSGVKEDGNSLTVGAGIEWATQNGAKVINVSSSTGPSLPMSDAVRAAIGADIVVVAASGNKPDFLQLGYPAAMDGVLAVGAVDRLSKHTKFSITGTQLQICAPGVDIASTGVNDRYVISDGTSPATAIVSGAAALVRAKFPQLSAPEVIERLTSTADDIGPPGRDDQCGFGVLNIVKALTANIPSAQNPSSSAAAVPSPGRTTGVASPSGEDDDEGNPAAVFGGVAAGLVVLGGLLAFLIVRRRRSIS